MSISENIAAIRREIHLAAAKNGRTGADITLVGASKMNDAAACREAIAAGIDVLGENRVQEMTQSWLKTLMTACRCTSSAISSATRSNRWWVRQR